VRCRKSQLARVDERTYPHLYRLAWDSSPADWLSEREEFLAGVDLILDGVQAGIERARHSKRARG
jgi:hypothetical protein